MSATADQLFREAMSLPPEARADLTDRLVESLAQNIPADIEAAQIAEVRRRISQVENGEVALIPGDEVMAHVRQRLKSARMPT